MSPVGPLPNGSLRLGCCRNRMTSVHSQGSSVSRRQNWIRAWDSGEPATSHSAAQAIECVALACSRWAAIPSMATVASGSRALAWLHDRVSTRLHALRRMAVSRLNMLHFSLCKIARSEPSRVGAGTWRRQVRWKANPRCRRVRVYTNQRGSNRRSSGQDEHAGLALLGGLMEQLHNRSARAVQLNLRSNTGTSRRAGQR